MRGGAASLHADRRGARGAGVRHQRQDEPAAARGGRPRGDARGLRDGSIDVIATDHAPHHADEKMVEFDRAPFGIVGLETAVPLVPRPAGAHRPHRAAAAGRAAVGQPGARFRRAGRDDAEGGPADLTILAPDLTRDGQAQRRCAQVQEHAVRRLAVARRRCGHDCRRPGRLSKHAAVSPASPVARRARLRRPVPLRATEPAPAEMRAPLSQSRSRLYGDYNREDSAGDTVYRVRPYAEPADREIAGFCAAALAFGGSRASSTRSTRCSGS